MHLYSVKLQKPGAITCAVSGSFSAPKKQEIVVSRGKILELLRPDEEGKVQTILSVEVFGVIRDLRAFRLTGGSKDYIVVGSDSGRIVILEYNAEKNMFEKVHQETYGKTGCRRIVPGEYLAVDPRGRAVMIGAVEKQKFVYVLNRDTAARLTISSPLEAHKSHTVCYSMVALDVGYENPLFACLELDHGEADQDHTGEAASDTDKMLILYELDLGLNHVVRKSAEPVSRSAHALIPVPGDQSGPGGVLVCSENFITYKNIEHPEITVPIPRREDMDIGRGLMVVSYAVHKQRDMFFFMVQSECGDLYKVTLDHAGGEVKGIEVKYFDTVPVANSICVLKTGFLFVASEFSNHKLYQFQALGVDNEDLITGEVELNGRSHPIFKPRPLKNLWLFDDIDSLAPITDFDVVDLYQEGTPQIVTLTGRGPQSSLRVLRHGLAVSNLATETLPGKPFAVWTARQSLQDEFDKYIIVSFVDGTIVLEIGENIAETTTSGILGSVKTIAIGQFGENGIIQVHPDGIRHIQEGTRVSEWRTPGKKTIDKAAINERQVVIALSGGELIYFELDQTDSLREVEKRDMGQDIACITVGPVPEHRLRSRYMAVGFYDKTVHIMSLDPEDCMKVLSRQTVDAEPHSLCMAEMMSPNDSTAKSLYVFIGLHNGLLVRSLLDSITGELSAARMRFLGTRRVELFKTKIKGSVAVLALSSRTWLSYNYQNKFYTTPLSHEPFEYTAGFTSGECPEGLVAIAENRLHILNIERLGETFNQTVFPLTNTPRKFVVDPETNRLVIIETDHNALVDSEKKQSQPQDMEVDGQQNGNAEELPEREFGAPKTAPNSGKWASYIRVFDPRMTPPTEEEEEEEQPPGVTTDLLELPANEAAFSMTWCKFAKDEQKYLIVGTAKDLQLFPKRSCDSGYLHTYRVVDEGRRLELVHKTPVEDVPGALIPFQGRLLAGVGRLLRIYEIGKAKLLRKCENKAIPNFVTKLEAYGDRIYVGDITESFHFVKYKRSENKMTIFADDTTPRWITAATRLDYYTMAGGDKFGNFFVCRLPQDVDDNDVDDEASGNRWIWERGYLNGAPNKIQEAIQFHLGEVITGLKKTTLVPGGTEVIVYSTVMGSIGVFIPFSSKEDEEFFSTLEMQMRETNPPLCGRDHLVYRSFYFPVKDVVDGDLCEQFISLEAAKQRSVAEELEMMPSAVSKKLEDIRNFVL